MRKLITWLFFVTFLQIINHLDSNLRLSFKWILIQTFVNAYEATLFSYLTKHAAYKWDKIFKAISVFESVLPFPSLKPRCCETKFNPSTEMSSGLRPLFMWFKLTTSSSLAQIICIATFATWQSTLIMNCHLARLVCFQETTQKHR